MRRFFGRGSSVDSPQQASPSSESPSPRSSPPEITTTSGGSPKPIKLVYCDANGKFQMDPEAVAMLQLVKGPVGVVSVCGRARQGKSFILNQLLGRSSGFVVASTQKPCTKGIWLWSAPLKRTALDGTEYNLLLLDTEGIDAYDQTGTYSTQIFSLAVLLSTMFIYNQMGGIDETALDRLSLVTEMTKHIRVKASGGRSTPTELGQFSPIFVWLLRDFYLDLMEDNRRITPRDYLELALRPVQGGGKDVAAKNEIRQSIRALFPDRECFTLVRPLSNETDLRHLDQIPLDKLRPEFRSGLDALTRFVFERTRPKQVGGTVMTGPLLARITQSFLDALNNGAVPTITSSWKSVEESECQRAYDLAAELYMSSFDRSKAPEEAALREAHEYAVQKSLAAFNSTAVGTGPTREKYEKRLQTFLNKAFEDTKRDAFREAYLLCSNAINNMEKELRTACNSPNTKVDHVIQVLDGLISKYESECNGPEKWKKLAVFLRQSLEGPIHDRIRKQIDQIGSERSSLALKCRGIGDLLNLRNKQLEAAEQQKSEYLKRYEDAISDKKKLADEYMHRIHSLQSKCSSLEERCSSASRTLDSAKQESVEWKRKYGQLSSKQKAEEEQATSEIALHKSRTATAEARLAAAHEQAQSAQEEAEEWKRRYNIAVREAKSALEKAAAVQERTNKQTQLREDALRAEFSATFAEKEEEIRVKTLKIEQTGQRLTTLNLELKAAEAKIRNYDSQISSLRIEIKELGQKLENSNAAAQSFEQEARILEQEKTHLEQKYHSEFSRFEEVQERCKSAEKEAKRALELADNARAEAVTAQMEKSEFQRMAMEGRTQLERAKRDIEKLERQLGDLMTEVQKSRAAELEAQSKVAVLESRVEEREKEIESLLKSNNEQRASTVHVLEELLENERAARAQAFSRAEALSVQLQATQNKLDQAQQQLTSMRLNETALDGKLRTASHGKRVRAEDNDMDMDDPQPTRRNKRSRSTSMRLNETALDGKLRTASHGKHVRAEDNDMDMDDPQPTRRNKRSRSTSMRLNETALDGKLRTASHGKHVRAEDNDMDMDDPQPTRRNKRSRSTASPLKFGTPEDGGSVFRVDEDSMSQHTTSSEDYTKFTVQKLKQELTKHNFGAELLQLKNPNKKDILALYEKCILKKS